MVKGSITRAVVDSISFEILRRYSRESRKFKSYEHLQGQKPPESILNEAANSAYGHAAYTPEFCFYPYD